MTAAKPHDAFPVKTAARLTGLSPDILRIWERRYGAVRPVRHRSGGARLYSGADVTRLKHLKHLVDQGRRIGDIAALNDRALAAMVGTSELSVAAAPERRPGYGLIEALEHFDADGLAVQLGDALAGLGAVRFIGHVAAPLLVEVGERWADGRGSVGEERLVSGALRNLLGSLVFARRGRGDRRVVLATPHGERHDLGLVMTAILALDAGVSVTYLGADLPADEIAAAVRRAGASVLALGTVYRANRARAVAEIRSMQRALPAGTELWVGGSDAPNVVKALRTKGAVAICDLEAVAVEKRRVGGTT